MQHRDTYSTPLKRTCYSTITNSNGCPTFTQPSFSCEEMLLVWSFSVVFGYGWGGGAFLFDCKWQYIQPRCKNIGSEKTIKMFRVLLTQTGFEPLIFWLFGSRIRRSTNWATPSPHVTCHLYHRVVMLLVHKITYMLPVPPFRDAIGSRDHLPVTCTTI